MLPLDKTEFSDALDDASFDLAREGKKTPDGLPIQKGDVAIKGNSIIAMNEAALTFSVTGTRTKEIVSTFHELEECLSKSNVNLKNDAAAYSLTATYSIDSGKNALEMIQKFYSSFEKASKFDEILKSKMGMTSVTLFSLDKTMDMDDYHQIRIEPLFQRLGKIYYCNIAFRNTDRGLIEDWTSNIEKNIADIIKIIESS